MFLVRLYLFVCVELFLYAKCSIPVEKLCVNPTCQEPISKAQGAVKYTPSSRDVLAFDKGQEITIISKSRNKEDYWGAIIKGKSGYVPSTLVKEIKIFHKDRDLIPVTIEAKQNAFVGKGKPMENNTSDQGPAEITGNMSQPVESVAGTPDGSKPPNTLESSIKPHEPFEIIEGTTIYSGEAGEIKPSSTVEMKPAGQTVDPASSNINSQHDAQERVTVPPEIINHNSNYKAQSMQNVTGFVIESVKENDENAVVESRDIDDEDDDGDDDNEEDDEEEGDEEDEEGEDLQENLNKQIPPNQFLNGKEGSNVVTTDKSDGNTKIDGKPEEIMAETNHSVPGNIEKNETQNTVHVVENSVTTEPSASDGNSNIETQPHADLLSQAPPHQNVDVKQANVVTETPPSTWSILNGNKELKMPSQPAAEGFQIKYGNPQPIMAEPQAPSKSQAVPAEVREMTPKGHVIREVSATEQTPPSGEGGGVTAAHELSAGVSVGTAQNTTENPHPGANEEMPTEAHGSTPPPIASDTSTIFSQFSVSADSLPEDLSSDVEESSPKPEIIQQKVEVTTEAFAASHPSSVETPSPLSESTQTWEHSSASDKITPESMRETVDVATEPPVTPSVPVQDAQEASQNIEDGQAPDQSPQADAPSHEDAPEEPSALSQITTMISSWFTSAPGNTQDSPNEPNNEAAVPDFQPEGQPSQASAEPPPSGKCTQDDFGSDCKEFASEDQSSFWSGWMPSGLGAESLLTSGNTFAYLVVTAVTVLLFTLGHNFIEKRGKTGPLIAKINKLEHELLVSSKECLMLKDEIQSLREKMVLCENSANDEVLLSLQAELEESKRARSELESSVEILQQELDAATEAGLDLNKMLSEVLTQKGGSESLLKSVENLQEQLDCQQKVIDEMTRKLGVKNQENEALQTALDAANDKSESLEEQLGDIKHNLNLHLKEKDELTRDLNSQINQLKIRINQLGESKEKDISKLNNTVEDLQKKLSESASALTVKEEELKALKESVKHLKGKGDLKLDTVFDVSRVKGELAKEQKENHALMERLQKEESSKKALVEQMKILDGEVQKLRKGYEEAEQKKDEAEKKLEVLSTYFKEKETQLQKELGLQEALWAQKKGDEKAVYNMMKSLQEEVESYKSQNETLKKEILDQERGLKNQIAILEQKAHENWVAARQAERKLEETKQEMAQLRNRLTLIEKNTANAEGKPNIRSSEELNGVEAASPVLHDTSSPLLFPPLPIDPNSSSLLPPGFMPPPMFIPPPMGGFIPPPPFLPGDRRPPPLGRMSSPPLNNRFSPSSPADYPFERMSSPPLSPPGANFRSNEERDHYRHRTPPFPPPLHPRNWDDGTEMTGFVPISSQRDSRRDHKGSNVSSEHSSSESLDKSSRHSGRV